MRSDHGRRVYAVFDRELDGKAVQVWMVYEKTVEDVSDGT